MIEKNFFRKTLRGFVLLVVILVIFFVLRSCCVYCHGEVCEWINKFLVMLANEIQRIFGY